MFQRSGAAVLAAAVVVSFVAARVSARPPDLPLDTRDLCVPVSDLEYLKPNRVIAVQLLRADELPPLFPELGGRELNRLIKDLRALLGRVSTLKSAPPTSRQEKPQNPRSLTEASRLFRIAERCRRDGEIDMAIAAYEEATRLDPRGGYARLASQRLTELRRISTPPVSTPQTPEVQAIQETEIDLQKLADARIMFEIGQRCERGGDLDSAQRCYEEAHRICPASRFGKQGLERLLALERQRKDIEQAGFAEKQQTPAPAPQALPRSLPMFPKPGGIDMDLDVRNIDSRSLFSLAEWRHRLGHVEEAARYYQEIRRRAADSDLGHKADERLLQIERLRSRP